MRTIARVAAPAVLIMSLSLAPGAVVGEGAAGQDDAITPRPVSIVMLVDESGSLRDDGVAAEREATAIIAQAEISANSQIAVIGFGGNTGQPGQTPVVTRCQPTTVATSQDRDYLSRCVQDIHRRTDAEGPATDYPRALDQAMSMFSKAPGDSRKILFLLTDGKLDVSDDPSYGQSSSAEDRNGAALRQMREKLAGAEEAGVQVWPLGFGAAVQSQLDEFAALGSQELCGPGSTRPRARIVTDPAQVADSLAEAYAAARCAGTNRSETLALPTGQEVTLHVEVPRIATDGSIAVIKRDARIRVEYRDPSGTLVPKSGSAGESTFQVSGEGSAVEVLRIANPVPGRWGIRLISSPGVGGQDVTATVIWQGAVRASATLNPPSPRAGEVVVAEVSLDTRRERLADPGVLTGLTVVATLTGDGFDPVELALSDDGTGRDEHAGDGTFSAEFPVPSSATGRYRLVGAVGGVGIESSQVPFDGRVETGQSTIRAQVRLPDERVVPGGVLGGTIEITNDSGSSRTVRLQLVDFSAGTVATVSPARLAIPASGTASLPFQITVDAATQVGSRGFRLLVVDDVDATVRYADKSVSVNVGYPPPWWQRYLRWLVALAALVLLAVAMIALRNRRRRAERDVRGLKLLLYRDDVELGFLVAPDQPAAQFRFVIRDQDVGRPRLDNAGQGVAFVVTRGPAGAVIVRTPAGERLRLKPGVPEPVGDDLALAVSDARDGDTRHRRFSRPEPVVAGTAATGPPPSVAGQPTASNYDDLL